VSWQSMRGQVPRAVAAVLLLAGALSGAVVAGAASPPLDPRAETLAELPHLVDELMVSSRVPGVAVAIVTRDEVVFAGGFGQRDRAARLPVDADTIFGIGSVTKAITALAATMLAGDGKLDLDRPVRAVLPDFRLGDLGTTMAVTTRDLLAHRTGLGRHDLVWYRSPRSREETVAALQHLELSAPLRSRFVYANLDYVVAGRVVERLSGASWEDFVSNRVFAPLAMGRTSAGPPAADDPNQARPYGLGSDGQPTLVAPYDGWAVAPAMGVASSASDLGRLLQMLLRRGTVGGVRLLDEAAVRELFTPQIAASVLGPPELPLQTYGLGWFVQSYRGHLVAWHGGVIDGYSCLVSLLPYDDYGIVVLTNRTGHRVHEVLSRWLYDSLLGLPELDWIKWAEGEQRAVEERQRAAAAVRAERRAAGGPPTRPLSAFVGRYQNPAYGELEVRLDGDVLAGLLHGVSAPLDHFAGDTFVFRFTFEGLDQELAFAFLTGLDGSVSSVLARVEEGAAPITFLRVGEGWPGRGSVPAARGPAPG
jgi:CubicO group peptidase (beta-lactamase class C family)